ncbi:asparagine synthase-related protein [Pseudonocardia saturnea]
MTVAAGGFPALGPAEVLVGRPIGTSAVPAVPGEPDPDPAAALRTTLRAALLRTPCVVAFSGGRDSALLLAVAASVARADGLAAPVALTLRYPGDPAAEETSWQELLLEHLRATGTPVEQVCHDVTDELDVLSARATALLRAHGGPTWPAVPANTMLLAGYATGGALITGNGGDELLGGHRAAVLRAVLGRRGRGLTAADRRHALACATPGRLRARVLVRPRLPWLRPPAHRAVTAELRRAEAARPLRFDRSVLASLAPRAVAVGTATRTALAAGAGAALVEPLADPAVVTSYAAHGGPLGGMGRAAGTRLLAAGALPDAVLERRDKAWFNASRFGAPTRAFARRWRGDGVDPALVDVAALRVEWLSGEPSGATALLLQQAWLASAE